MDTRPRTERESEPDAGIETSSTASISDAPRRCLDCCYGSEPEEVGMEWFPDGRRVDDVGVLLGWRSRRMELLLRNHGREGSDVGDVRLHWNKVRHSYAPGERRSRFPSAVDRFYSYDTECILTERTLFGKFVLFAIPAPHPSHPPLVVFVDPPRPLS